MTTRTSRGLSEAVARLKAMYQAEEPTDFIAMEFMVSPEIHAAVLPGSLLWGALRDGESGIPEQGFAWLGTDNRLARIIDVTRAEIRRSGNADDILTSLLVDAAPEFLTPVEKET